MLAPTNHDEEVWVIYNNWFYKGIAKLPPYDGCPYFKVIIPDKGEGTYYPWNAWETRYEARQALIQRLEENIESLGETLKRARKEESECLP